MPILREPITTTALYDGRVLIPTKKPALSKGKFWIVMIPEKYEQVSSRQIDVKRKKILQAAKGIWKNRNDIDPIKYQQQMRDELEEHFSKSLKIK